ncbi:GH12 family glycosyl hydrolase domain-containing protein [Cuniculiplasma sp. SKW4]|uniref:GH12 family glycosyl hydrolase domain-containing protein n=1 Tax=Cuniculiplasma sp. SKW4 TaxID=3400171 RepID=UPI003FD08918
MGKEHILIEAKGREINCSFPTEYGLIQSNMWNLEEMDGFVIISEDEKSLNFNIEIKSGKIKKKTIFGYPEVCVGNNLLGQKFNEKSDIKFQFPVKLKDILEKNINLLTKFSIEDYAPSDLPFNISYDFWIKKDMDIRMPNSEEYEIMIWVFKNKQRPIGEKMGNTSIQCKIEGNYEECKFDLWYGSASQWKTITFTVDESSSMSGKRMEIPISQFLLESLKYMNKDSGEMYLMGLELGSEFGNPEHTYTKLQWKLEEYGLLAKNTSLNIVNL